MADDYLKNLTTAAATLAAALQPRDAEDAVAKYRKVMAELKKGRGLYDDGSKD